ncbi:MULTISPECIES: cell division protein CrgA [unclassified Pseudactinotalea]|uniref:cell division protein CrgA n=1 Tax=unclassified Pseudactinotalea TaxID=2649176 RepID=UPI00128B1491|nr:MULTISPECIES: cell division protein CrgA [unclassified Pseudactinotalea]MPV49195.1 cell division protein CrgA [Pseudactinotalea sp. HY160]QGH68132.1 cell division protein CrgA [Pseudactinotalea sp. HY158]
MPKSKPRKKSTYTPPPASTEAVPNPVWWVPVMVTLGLVGLAWIVATYVFNGQYPVPGIGNWNLGIGFALVFAGFIMTMRWR